MTLRVYNTLTKQKDLFEPVRPGKVSMYLCGPTVYKSPHIGHMVGPVIFDAIKRYLQYKGYEVTWVVNITDVDDKLINAANKAERRSVRILGATETGVSIASGLSGDERVVATAGGFLRDGEPVRVAPAAPVRQPLASTP